ncbi:MAG: hypothetical protein IKL80_01565 [Clostridia bacterium]|nr:hypothetical protein [Clostridia bacterium]
MFIKRVTSAFLSAAICLSLLAVPAAASEENGLEEISVGAVHFYGNKDATGEVLPDLRGATAVSAKTSLLNNSESLQTAALYVGCYSADGMLMHIAHNEIELIAGQVGEVSAGTEIEKATSGCYAKAFIWKETNQAPVPVVKAETLMATDNIYVSPTGNDEAEGSFYAPLQTVDAARMLVQEKNDSMTQDLNVYLRGGTYQLENTLTFTEADSGTGESFVNYQAYNDEQAVLSGGTKIEGFTVYDEEKNIWRAQVAGTEPVRELYVNGIKARRATGENRIYPKGFYKETVDETEIVKGYIVSAEDVGLYQNAEDIQLHYTRIWKNTLCNVSEIVAGEEGKTIIKMDPTAFSKAIASTAYVPLTEDISFYIENAYELLDTA